MAISVEHLGGQVQCPHCRSVVQTPARPAAPKKPAPRMEIHERDSIFAGEVNEDVIGDGGGRAAQPTVQLPVEKRTIQVPPNQVLEPTVVTQVGAPPADRTPAETPAAADDAETDLPEFQPRPIYDRSMLTLVFMIFLVPYAIMTTLFIIYLLTFAPVRSHPLDMMPDPVPGTKKGGPRPVGQQRQTVHNHPLAAHQRVPLGQSIQVGDLIVQPLHVRLTEEGDLALTIKAKNVSKNTAFEPINDFYVRYKPSEGGSEPYTYLESKSREVANIYGGFLEFQTTRGEKADGMLGPNDESLFILTTMPNYHPFVKTIAKTNDEYLWRVQVRRGFVKYRNKDVSATAVFGVEFTSQQIERWDKKA